MKKALHDWVQHVASHTMASRAHVWTGSDEEVRALEDKLVSSSILARLEPGHHPNSLVRLERVVDPGDLDATTFVSAKSEDNIGPTSNALSRAAATKRMWPLFAGVMRHRTLYVVPYALGPAGSSLRSYGVQITDSPEYVLALQRLVDVGPHVLEEIERGAKFVRGLHSRGNEFTGPGMVCHFAENRTVWAIGIDGATLFGRKSHSIRLSTLPRMQEEWVACRMAIIGVRGPSGAHHYVAASFEADADLAEFAFLGSTLPGWTIETVAHDVAWLYPGSDGRLWAVSPERGAVVNLLDAAGGLRRRAAGATRRDALFAKGALEESTAVPGSIDDSTTLAHEVKNVVFPWSSLETATHENADPYGVPLGAILFGVRRGRPGPLVVETTGWEHGAYVGGTMEADGHVGARPSPMTMRSFCGCAPNEYLARWLSLGRALRILPKVYRVRLGSYESGGEPGSPGDGQNARVFQWISERLEGTGSARLTAAGFVPFTADLDGAGQGANELKGERLWEVNPIDWREELARNEQLIGLLGPGFPVELQREHGMLALKLHETTHRTERRDS